MITRFVSRPHSQVGVALSTETLTNSRFGKISANDVNVQDVAKFWGKSYFNFPFCMSMREIEFGACENRPKHVFNLLRFNTTYFLEPMKILTTPNSTLLNGNKSLGIHSISI